MGGGGIYSRQLGGLCLGNLSPGIQNMIGFTFGALGCLVKMSVDQRVKLCP